MSGKAGAGVLFVAGVRRAALLFVAGEGETAPLGKLCRGLLGKTEGQSPSPQAGMGGCFGWGVVGGAAASALCLSPSIFESTSLLALVVFLLRAAVDEQQVHARYPSTPTPIAPTTPPMIALGKGAVDEGTSGEGE